MEMAWSIPPDSVPTYRSHVVVNSATSYSKSQLDEELFDTGRVQAKVKAACIQMLAGGLCFLCCIASMTCVRTPFPVARKCRAPAPSPPLPSSNPHSPPLSTVPINKLGTAKAAAELLSAGQLKLGYYVHHLALA